MKKTPMFDDPSTMLDISNYLYGAAAFLTLVATFGVIYFGRQATKVKDAQVRQYQKEADARISEAGAQSAGANARAEEAKQRVAQAEALSAQANQAAEEAKARAEEARATAEQSKLDKASIERDNLVLRAQIDQERQGRARIEEQLRPRTLTRQQQQDAIDLLRGRSHSPILFITFTGDNEANVLAGQVGFIFQEVGWERSHASPTGGSYSGVGVFYRAEDETAKDNAAVIAKLLTDMGLRVQGPTPGIPLNSYGAYGSNGEPRAATITIIVGTK